MDIEWRLLNILPSGRSPRGGYLTAFIQYPVYLTRSIKYQHLSPSVLQSVAQVQFFAEISFQCPVGFRMTSQFHQSWHQQSLTWQRNFEMHGFDGSAWCWLQCNWTMSLLFCSLEKWCSLEEMGRLLSWISRNETAKNNNRWSPTIGDWESCPPPALPQHTLQR